MMSKFFCAILAILWAACAAFGQSHTYWGDPHGHSALSDGQGTPGEYVDEICARPSYYYARVIQTDTDPHGNHSHAWSSPIWVKPKR